MKRLIFVACLSVACVTAFAQENLSKTYRSFQVVGHYQTLAEPLLSYEYTATHPFNPEIGINYQIELGTTRFYFDPGVYLGYFKAQTHEFPDEDSDDGIMNKSSRVRVKLPICFDYVLHASDALVVYPSFGVSIGLGYEDWSSVYDDDKDDYLNEFGSDFIIGGVMPHLGINAIVNNKYHVGLGYEIYLNTGFMVAVQSVLFKAGIAF